MQARACHQHAHRGAGGLQLPRQPAGLERSAGRPVQACSSQQACSRGLLFQLLKQSVRPDAVLIGSAGGLQAG